MRVLVACEHSGAVREAFRKRGHDAWSNDLLPAADGSPFHIQGDALDVIGSQAWDLAICHPPCRYLCSSGLHWNKRVEGRNLLTEEALKFVSALLNSNVPRIALENPIGCISSRIRKPDQIIQPYQFGHDASKGTCLWLKNLPLLRPTLNVDPVYGCGCGYKFAFELGKYGCPKCEGTKKAKTIWGNQTASGQNKLGPSPERWAERSKTYAGIAEAMAEQWGGHLEEVGPFQSLDLHFAQCDGTETAGIHS